MQCKKIKERCNWVILVFRDFSSPIFFVGFYVPWIVMRTLFGNSFQSNLFYSSWYTPLVYVSVNFFFQCGLLCLFFIVFFPSQPDVVNITWIIGYIHRSIVDKIDPTSEDVERVKIPYQLHWVTYFCEMWSEEFIYRAFNWSVKNTFDEPWRGSPFFSSKVEEWLMMTFVMENCLLDLFVVLNLHLEPVWIDNSCLVFFVSQIELNI